MMSLTPHPHPIIPLAPPPPPSFYSHFYSSNPFTILTFVKEKDAAPECQNDNYWVGLGCIVPWDFLGPIPPPST